MDVKSFMKQCRLCSSFCDTEISIFPENKTGKKSLYSKMATCLPIKVTLDDQLPKNICLTCYRTMESMYKFYVMTVETEKKLYEQLDAIRRAFDYEQGEEIVVLPDCELNTNSIPKLEPIDFIEEVNELSFEDCFLQPDVGGNDEDTSELLNIDKENLSTIDEDKSELITEMDEQKDELRPDACLPKLESVFIQCSASLPPSPVDDVSSTSDWNVNNNASGYHYPEVKQEPSLLDGSEMAGGDTNSDSVFPCPECDNKFYEKHHMLVHYQRIHRRIIRSYCCEQCSWSGWYKRDLNKHMHSKHSQPKFACGNCSECFLTKTLLRQHEEAEHFPTYGLFYQCHHCDQQFIDKRVLIEHIKNRHPEYIDHRLSPMSGALFYRKINDTCFECKLCDFVAADRQSMLPHRMVHSALLKYRCDRCEKCFSLRSRYLSHMNSHLPVKPFECDLCHKRFIAKRNVQIHVQAVHQKVKSYRCNRCGKVFSYKSSLRLHTETHNGTRQTYVCDICGKIIYSRASLAVHRDLHLGRRNHRCTDCDKSYSSQSQLKRHRYLVHHSQPIRVQCAICGKSVDSRYLKSHMLLHNKSRRPHRCSYCNKEYFSAARFSSHMKIHRKPLRLSSSSNNKSTTAAAAAEPSTTNNAAVKRDSETIVIVR